MIRVGLISDTHIPEAGSALPEDVYRFFRGVDILLHAGDIHVIEVIDWLEGLAPVYGVRGNGDDGGSGRPLVPDDPRLLETQVLEIGGLQIAMLHTYPWYMEYPKPLEEGMFRRFGQKVDVIVHGDTHVAEVEHREGVLIVNPGSPTLPNNLTRRPGTVGILEIENRHAAARLFQLYR